MFRFTQILVLKTWAKTDDYQLQKGQNLLLQQEGYLGRQISKNLKLSKTEIHRTTVKFRNFVSFQDLLRSGNPRVASHRDDHLKNGW